MWPLPNYSDLYALLVSNLYSSYCNISHRAHQVGAGIYSSRTFFAMAFAIGRDAGARSSTALAIVRPACAQHICI